MKVMTILGTRPEIIRLSRIIPLLDNLCEHYLVHTGQNYDPGLSDIFFEQLNIRKPDAYLGVKASSFAEQIGQIMARMQPLFEHHRPDRVVLLGDTNSALVALVAQRMGLPVYHMEAGNRCFDNRVPEEVNRRVIDHCSSILLPYTHRSKENLLWEGFPINSILVTGNPIYEVISHYQPLIDVSQQLSRLGLEKKRFFLTTFHREENVDQEERLRGIVEGLIRIQERFGYPVICSIHPRTAERIQRYRVDKLSLTFLPPMSLFDFVHLEQNAFCVLSDSGTVQEECCILGTPTVTLRDVTERPETLECGSNYLSGVNPASIERAVVAVTSLPISWQPPAEYLVPNVAATVARIVLEFRPTDV